jgi:signal transduction histidine kinase
MSLTTKLILGFLFALVLQVLQMAVSSHFTARMQDAAAQVSAALAASNAVQSGLEATGELRQRTRTHRAAPLLLDLKVLEVYAEEVRHQVEHLGQCAGGAGELSLAPLDEATDSLGKQLAALGSAIAAHDADRAGDELAFLDDDAAQLEQDLRQTQVRIRHLAEDGVRREQSVRDLPMRVSLGLTLGGVMLMALFVAWFSRQLVLPIQRAWAQLESRVEERTRELAAANRDLQGAKEAADRANQSKSAFLANVSHELRSPMTAILGYTEELQRRLAGRPTDGFEGEALETIRRNSQHLVAVVGDLLDIAKIEAGKLAVDLQPCHPAQIVADVMALLRPKALANQVEVQFAPDRDVPATVQSDPVRLRQMATNLLDNAIKFTRGGHVVVRMAWIDGTTPCLRIEVDDDGCGMSDDLLRRLFQPFEQENPTLNRRHGGTGLGLALSRQFARLLGGELTARAKAAAAACSP